MENKRNIMATVKFLLPSLTPAEKRVAEFILSSPGKVPKMSLQKLAKRCECGEATIVRLCRTIGVSGYAELKQVLEYQLANCRMSEEVVEFEPGNDMSAIMDSVFKINILNLQKTLEVAAVEEYEKACKAIIGAKKICFFAIGDALLPCNYAELRFRRIGFNCYSDSDADAQIVNACNMEAGDAAIAVSHSGNSRQVVDAMKIAKERGAVTICITKAGKSELTKYSDIVLYNVTADTTIDKEIIARRVSEQAMLDVLYMGVYAKIEDKITLRQQDISEKLLVNKLALHKNS